ncbi:hypothetical protein ASG29_06575 [Sphingomonas sp. Leaf412]|uniref:hypothetical protein n=1 Tax=Sphingomonas sp. Leaf412 TaxID=1736370 RepID=UPI0006FBAE2E|nr:hypothetical protein [Sphingomonas sp. Leaf412]KQT33671.1 hypothetical protein ASG29_06575 [Sphingomonas sp. Leaf412]
MAELETTALSRTGTWLRTMAEHRSLSETVRVSRASVVTDGRWTVDLRQPSDARTSVIYLDGLPEPLADEIRIALLVGMAHPSSTARSAKSMAALGHSLTMIGRWMVHGKIGSFGELGAGCGELFLDALKQFHERKRSDTHEPGRGHWEPRPRFGKRPGKIGDTPRATRGLVKDVASAFLFLRRNAALLERYGGAAPRGDPFGHTAAQAVATDWADDGADRTTERLPDAVLERLVSGATRMMGVPADDAIRLVKRLAALCARGLTGAEAAERLRDFRFGKVEGETSRWRDGLLVEGMSPIDSIRQIVHLVRDAAYALHLLGVGQRPGEALGLRGGRHPPKGTERAGGFGLAGRPDAPWCLSEAPSKSGFSTVLHLHGHVYKREATPRPVRWVVGGRQPGEGPPDALLALEVLERLHAPLRRFAPKEAQGLLVVDFASEAGEPLRTDWLVVTRLSASMKRSIPRFADFSGIPDEEMGRDLRKYREPGPSCIALYAFRKTYAQTLYKLYPGLLMAIARQLQHASPDFTMKDYVTGDPSFQRELELFRSRHTVLLFDEIMDGVATTAHTMDAAMDRVLGRVAGRGAAIDPTRRDAIWAEQAAAPQPLFARDGLRPAAGLVAAFMGAGTGSDLAMEGSVPDSIGAGAPRPDRARNGAAIMRTYVTERRRAVAAAAAGDSAAGREARDRVLAAARALGSSGFRNRHQAAATAPGITTSEGEYDDE